MKVTYSDGKLSLSAYQTLSAETLSQQKICKQIKFDRVVLTSMGVLQGFPVIEAAAHKHSSAASPDLHVTFVPEHNAAYLFIQQLSVCQLLHSHPTPDGEYQCSYLPGCCVCGDVC